MLFRSTDADEMLTRHLQSEQEITVKKRGSAGYVKRWVKRRGFDANHLLDCTVYAFAIAYALKLFRLPDNAKIYGASAAQAVVAADNPEHRPPPRPARPAKKSYLPLIHGFLGK